MTVAANSAFSRDIARVLVSFTPISRSMSRTVRLSSLAVREFASSMRTASRTSTGWQACGASRSALASRGLSRRPGGSLQHCPTTTHSRTNHTEPNIDLADRILAILPVPMSKVFFNTSGSEANDSAVKMVWYYNNARGLYRKKKINFASQGLSRRHHRRREPHRASEQSSRF